MHPRLRDRLAVADRKRGILIGSVSKPGRDERMPRRLLERAQHREVTNALFAQDLDQALARASELALYKSRHHVAAPWSTTKCVRSSCSGVTETKPSSIARKSESGSPVQLAC